MASIQFEQPYHPDSKSSNLTFRPFVPNKSRYAARITEQQWESVRHVLERLHKAGRTRAMMLEFLSDIYDFKPSLAQLNARMVAWNYKVYDHIRQTKPTVNHDCRPDVDLEITSDQLHAVEKAETMTIDKQETARASRKEVGIILGQMIRNRVMQIVPAAAQYEQSAWFCIFHDITSLMLRSNWCSLSSHPHIQHLIHFVRNSDIRFTAQAKALILRDCLRWTKDCGDPYSIEWIFECYEDQLLDSDLDLTNQRRTLLSRCRQLYAMKGSYQSWSEWTADGDLPRPIARLHADIESSASPEWVLYSYGTTLTARSRLAGSVVLEETDATRELIHWCKKATENFSLASALMMEDASFCACDAKCYLHTSIAAHLLKVWSQYADSAATELSHIEIQTRSSWADLDMFQTISAVLITISFLVVESFEALCKSWSILGNLRQDRALSPATTQFVRNALRMVFLELALHPDRVLERTRYSKPSCGCDRKDSASTPHTPAYAIAFACEMFDLRRSPDSVRHQLAIEMLVNGTVDREKVKFDDDTDPMLFRMSSTSSFRSFRRSGMKLEAQRGASSMSTGSSKYSCGSSVYMIME